MSSHAVLSTGFWHLWFSDIFRFLASMSAWTKAEAKSICRVERFRMIERMRRSVAVPQDTTCEKTLWCLRPFIWQCPPAQSLEQNLLTVPFRKSLCLSAQTHGKTFIHGSLLTISQAAIFSGVSHSFLHASLHPSELGLFTACSCEGLSSS